MKESTVQKKLMEKLKDVFPLIYLRKIAQSIYSHGGIPDIIGSLNGYFFAIEVKTDKGKLSKLQQREGILIERAGGLFIVCKGVGDISRVVSVLRSATL